MDWHMPWYSAEASLETLLAGRVIGTMYLVCYVRDGGRVFETYSTTGRGVEEMDNNYALMDLTVYGRQEDWENSPSGWPGVARSRAVRAALLIGGRCQCGRTAGLSRSGHDSRLDDLTTSLLRGDDRLIGPGRCPLSTPFSETAGAR
jgi:hypothetical protein